MELLENRKNYLRPNGRGIKLHLGCGDYWFDGYLNIDIGVYGGTDMLFDIRQKLPFQDQVVEIIEAYEVVEHFTKPEIESMLLDWHRVLIPGGQIRVSVPDSKALLNEYVLASTQEEKDKYITYLYGFSGPQSHHWMYTESSLKKLFETAGFSCTVTQGKLPERPDEPKLIAEAIK